MIAPRLPHLLLLACSACSTPATSTGPDPAEAPKPVAPATSVAPDAPTSATAPKPSAAPKANQPTTSTPTNAPTRTIVTLCEALCVQRNQMRAVGPEVIEQDCQGRCTGIEGAAVDPACSAAAKTHRAKLEAQPMKDRAALFWTLLSDPSLSCDVSDPVLVGLSVAWSEPDPVRRSTAVRTQLAADPWIEWTCAAGAETIAWSTPAGTVDVLVERCPIAGASPGAPIHDDLDPVTFLAVEVVRTHWRALGATSSDHDVMLSTVLLSTALGNE